MNLEEAIKFIEMNALSYSPETDSYRRRLEIKGFLVELQEAREKIELLERHVAVTDAMRKG